MKTLFLLIGFHYLGDYGLQSDYIAMNKGKDIHVMIAHCAIQSLGVLIATNRWELALGEFIAHMGTDFAKCRGFIGLNGDQAIHLTFRVLWFVLSSYGGV